ncbi:MAG TPA: 2OG-Fe(II) oxygenase [Terriglobales bacterium]|nr:2OG-Fe(II) oxygenase [Terriglobales bacterium]
MNALKRDRHNRGSNVVDETVLPERKAVARATAPRGMAGVLTGTIRLPANVKSLSFDYRSATPFPYLILDNLFSEDLLDRVTQELPPLGDAHWVRHDDDHLRQFNLRSAADLGEAGSQVVAFLHSARFLYFLSEVTGIRDLLPDPYLQGAGYHMIPRGGKFDVHLDRNIAYSTGLIRRLSLLIYLNRDWKHEYGGQLELWSKDGKRPEVIIEPIFNRMTIFEVTDENYHGVPAVVRCPKGRSRNCFVVYYHTAQVREDKDLRAHTSIYGPRSYGQGEPKLRQFVKDLVPPVLLRGLRKLYSR